MQPYRCLHNGSACGLTTSPRTNVSGATVGVILAPVKPNPRDIQKARNPSKISLFLTPQKYQCNHETLPFAAPLTVSMNWVSLVQHLSRGVLGNIFFLPIFTVPTVLIWSTLNTPPESYTALLWSWSIISSYAYSESPTWCSFPSLRYLCAWKHGKTSF